MKTPEILFLCTGNSCRSILAEGTLNGLAASRLHALSAGSHPTGYVHPRSLALLKREGFSTEGLHSKSWDALEAIPDIVITVCASAAGETCPAYLGPALRVHWGVEDPAKVTGSEAEIEAAFEKAYQILRYRIEALLQLPVAERLEKHPAQLRQELERIGQMEPSALSVAPFVPEPQEFHLSFRVSDLARSTNFYERFFGVVPKQRTARFSTFIVPQLRLNLVILVNDREESPDTYSLYHIGLGVADKAAVIEAYHRAKDAGAEIVKPPRTTWAGTPLHELWLRDPTGYLLEIYARLTPEELAQKPADGAAQYLVSGTEA